MASLAAQGGHRPLFELLETARQLGLETLRNTWHHPVLVTLPDGDEGRGKNSGARRVDGSDIADALSDATAGMNPHRLLSFVRSTLRQGENPDVSVSTRALLQVRYYVLTKRPGHALAHRITIGRSGSNDVCIRHSEVSKLHAFLVINDGPSYGLDDAGARNGTRVNYVRVLPQHSVDLKDGDLVHVGPLGFVFNTPSGFCNWIAAVIAPSQ